MNINEPKLGVSTHSSSAGCIKDALVTAYNYLKVPRALRSGFVTTELPIASKLRKL